MGSAQCLDTSRRRRDGRLAIAAQTRRLSDGCESGRYEGLNQGEAGESSRFPFLFDEHEKQTCCNEFGATVLIYLPIKKQDQPGTNLCGTYFRVGI